MRRIQREISLEPMTSRLPSIWPAYLDGQLYYFDNDSLEERQYKHTSNYGMIPMNVPIPEGMVPMFKELEEKPDEEKECVKLSWYSISKWYHFFIEYYNLLKQYGHCNRIYTSAEDYYNYESMDKYASQMIYGSDRQTYIDLDEEFYEMGGEGFFNWICENVVPSFEIPMEYVDYWKTKRLFYPDVVKWMAWFSTRFGYENVFKEGVDGEIDTWDCKDTEDCCDCEDYFKRGGKRTYDLMKGWYDNLNIIKDGDLNEDCLLPTIITPIEMQISVDDLGLESIFSNEYELGIDYRTIKTETGETATTIHFNEGNTHSGTVVTMNGESKILTSGSGFTFDEDFMEKELDEDGWGSYTETYINENISEFLVSAVTYFAFDDKNVRYETSATTIENARADLKNKMSKKYDLITRNNGWCLIDGLLYEIDELEYGKYDENNQYIGGNKFIVYRDKNTNTPYVYLNGSEVYAEYYIPTDESDSTCKFYFPFFKERESKLDCNGKVIFNINDYVTYDRFTTSNTRLCITYDGQTVWSDDDGGWSIDEETVYVISGYVITEDNEVIYLSSDGEILITGEYGLLESYSGATYDGKQIIVTYDKEFDIFPIEEVTGKTVSKIGDLRLLNTLTDDIGNQIDGLYDVKGKKYHQPPEGTELDLLYQVGNTANIRRFSKTKVDMDDISGDANYFIGDIITDMVFYYKDSSTGEIDEDTKVEVTLTESGVTLTKAGVKLNDEVTGLTSLSAIMISTEIKEGKEEGCSEVDDDGNITRDCVIYIEDIYCDITYYKGATLYRKTGENFNLSKEENNFGVEYKETVKFVKKNREYYLKKPKRIDLLAPFKRNKVESHSVSYPVVVYEMVQDMENIESTEYGIQYDLPMADFRFKISVFKYDEEGQSGNTFDISGETEEYNGMQVFPTMREEYRLGSSMIENIDADIYIERGINAAYERHLKLGEVVTLEALTQYGNGYFKMMDS